MGRKDLDPKDDPAVGGVAEEDDRTDEQGGKDTEDNTYDG